MQRKKIIKFQHFKLQINTVSGFHLKAFVKSELRGAIRKVIFIYRSMLHKVNCAENIFFAQSDTVPAAPPPTCLGGLRPYLVH